MQDAANFMGGLAGKYCGSALKAIEVWNENNLKTEWDDNRGLSAELYMDMLRRSYTSIKAACPNMIVVSAAPTPTGWNDGIVAFDDGVWMEKLYQLGLKDYSDAIGIHPSGYNVPALCDITQQSCNRPDASYQAPFVQRHPSYGFMSNMLLYRRIMVKYGDGNKQLWPTEFGWPIQDSVGGAHPSAPDNTLEMQAEWFPQAYQWAKQQGWVGPMFAWNYDFMPGSGCDECAIFRIIGRPAFDALAAMPK